MKRAYVIALGLALAVCVPLGAASATDEAIPIAQQTTTDVAGLALALPVGAYVAGGESLPGAAPAVERAKETYASPKPYQEAAGKRETRKARGTSPSEVGGWPSCT